MTRVLIFGGTGMLGHKLAQVLGERFTTFATIRGSWDGFERYGIVAQDCCVDHVHTDDFESIGRAFDVATPDVVVNAIGVVKQQAAANDPVVSVGINALFPHKLSKLCSENGVNLVHISTDCVFSGRAGGYTETDVPDAEDLYGRSKLLGEVPEALTLRTSIIGRELSGATGLVEWFLSQRGRRVEGFTRAIFSGLPTVTLAHTIGDAIERQPDLKGLFHVSADAINKHDLLVLLRKGYGVDVDVEPTDRVRIDRSLDSSSFRTLTGWAPKPWPDLVQELVTDPTPYEEWRR